MIIRVGGESLNLVRIAPLRRGRRGTPQTSSSVVYPSTQGGRAARSKRIVWVRSGS